KAGFMWDGSDYLFGRHYSAMYSIEDMNATLAWSTFGGKLLSIFGTSDFEALNDVSHKEIVKIVNQNHPGNAIFWSAPETDHSFIQVGPLEEAVNMSRQEYGQLFQTSFNTEIPAKIINWIRDMN